MHTDHVHPAPAATTVAGNPIPVPTSDRLATSRARAWARVQAVSGLLFGLFALVHLVNTALAALGPAVYDGFQRALRPVYQYPLVELGLVLTPLLVHMLAAIVRVRMRRGTRAPTAARARLHRYAGYFLMLFILGHVAATRVPPVFYDVGIDFMGLAFTFQFLPQWFYVYYPLLALAGLTHLWIGVPLALGMLGLRVPHGFSRGPTLWLPLTVASLLVLLGVAGLGGLLFPVPADLSALPFAQLLRGLSGPVFGN